jgi:hypothetical protein
MIDAQDLDCLSPDPIDDGSVCSIRENLPETPKKHSPDRESRVTIFRTASQASESALRLCMN